MTNPNVPTKTEIYELLQSNEGISTSHIEMKIARSRGWEYEANGGYNDTTSIRQGAVYRLLKDMEAEGTVKGTKRGLGRGKLFWSTTKHLADRDARAARIKELTAEAQEKIVVRLRVEGQVQVALAEPVGDQGVISYTVLAEFSTHSLVDTKAEAEEFAAKLRKNYTKEALRDG